MALQFQSTHLRSSDDCILLIHPMKLHESIHDTCHERAMAASLFLPSDALSSLALLCGTFLFLIRIRMKIKTYQRVKFGRERLDVILHVFASESTIRDCE